MRVFPASLSALHGLVRRVKHAATARGVSLALTLVNGRLDARQFQRKAPPPRGFRTQEVRRFATAFFAQIASQRRFDASVVSYRTRLRPFATFRLVLAHALVLRLSTRKHVERTNGASEETSKRPDTDLAAALFHPNTDMRSTP